MVNRAVGQVGDPQAAAGPYVFSCEHASNALWGTPATAADLALVEDHWGWDPGAAAVCRALAQGTDSPAVLAGFSRLLIDPNRPLDSDTLIRADCDGLPVSFNQGLSAALRQARIDRFYAPYHAQAVATLRARRARGPVALVGVHSFTPDFRGEARPMDFGVLCTDDGARAQALCAALAGQGWRAAVNAPYSGHDGFMYAGHRFAQAAGGVPAVMIEIRQDHVRDAEGVGRVVAALAAALPAVAA